MTILPAQIHGRWFHYYMILDIRSRAIVGFEGHATDSADHAACLAQTRRPGGRACCATENRPDRPTSSRRIPVNA